MEGLVKPLCRMMSAEHWEAWHFRWTAVLVHARRVSHASKCSPDIILRRSFTRLSTALAVIEGLGRRLVTKIMWRSTKCPTSSGLRTRLKKESLVNRVGGGCYVKPCKTSLTAQSLTREERIWSNSHQAFVLHTQQQGATNEVGVNINWDAFWEGWCRLLWMKCLAL